jgi:hypothetical protein
VAEVLALLAETELILAQELVVLAETELLHHILDHQQHMLAVVAEQAE